MQFDEKEQFCQIYHPGAHYYVIISYNASVRMIGRLELAIGMLTWAWLTKIMPWSLIFLRCVWADQGLIVNGEHFAPIDQINRMFDYECNH